MFLTMVQIKDKKGQLITEVIENEDSIRKFTLMKEDYITLVFSTEEPIYFKLGDGVDNEWGMFELVDLYSPSYNESTGGYDYQLRLDAYYWKWKNKIFKYTPENHGQESSWSLTATLDVHLGVFLRNLQALEYKYRNTPFSFEIGNTVENASQLITYENTNLIDALNMMAETWDCEWWVTDSVIHFGKCEYGDPVKLELGVEVETMTREGNNQKFATRIYAFGSTNNIPSDYRPVDESVVVNGVVQKRLMLPEGTPYLDAYENMTQEEAVEDVVIFDDVYPRKIGTLSDITTQEYTDTIESEDGTETEEKWLAYRFKDTGINFSKEYILPGQELQITFQSGKLNGLTFGVIFNPTLEGEEEKPEKLPDGSWNPEAQLWEIVRNEDYGRPLPGGELIPANGDTYYLTGFNIKLVSGQYIPAAEEELKEKAQKYLDKTKTDPNTYNCTLRPDYVYNKDMEEEVVLRTFELGDKINLVNPTFFSNGRVSRVIGYERKLDLPYDHPVYFVGEVASISRIGELEDKVDALTYKGQTFTGNGSGVYVVGRYDSTPLSDRNVLSSLRSIASFLRKDKDDTASGLITFLRGWQSRDFAAGGVADVLAGRQAGTQPCRSEGEPRGGCSRRLAALHGDGGRAEERVHRGGAGALQQLRHVAAVLVAAGDGGGRGLHRGVGDGLRRGFGCPGSGRRSGAARAPDRPAPAMGGDGQLLQRRRGADDIRGHRFLRPVGETGAARGRGPERPGADRLVPCRRDGGVHGNRQPAGRDRRLGRGSADGHRGGGRQPGGGRGV